MSLADFDYSLYNNTTYGLVAWTFNTGDKQVILTPFMGQDFSDDSEAQMHYAAIEDET